MLELEDLPPGTRLKLDGEGEDELWREVDSRGGVRSFCGKTGFDEARVYSWKNHCSSYPVEFVLELVDDASPHVTGLKGGGRGSTVEDPELPLPVNRELLTRVEVSVSVNRDGVPVYRAGEFSLVERFNELLQELGNVPVSVYSRSPGYELRYPKIVHSLLEGREFEPDFAALVDERGRIEKGKLVAGNRDMDVENFSGELYSRDRRLELAVERNDREEIEKLIGEEARKVREAFG
ncbi:MAG: hypothetical protein ABEJ66_01065 [Candidatus Nanohaloarchaea archaeon]